jgi:hypothetical protein
MISLYLDARALSARSLIADTANDIKEVSLNQDTNCFALLRQG